MVRFLGLRHSTLGNTLNDERLVRMRFDNPDFDPLKEMLETPRGMDESLRKEAVRRITKAVAQDDWEVVPEKRDYRSMDACTLSLMLCFGGGGPVIYTNGKGLTFDWRPSCALKINDFPVNFLTNAESTLLNKLWEDRQTRKRQIEKEERESMVVSRILNN